MPCMLHPPSRCHELSTAQIAAWATWLVNLVVTFSPRSDLCRQCFGALQFLDGLEGAMHELRKPIFDPRVHQLAVLRGEKDHLVILDNSMCSAMHKTCKVQWASPQIALLAYAFTQSSYPE